GLKNQLEYELQNAWIAGSLDLAERAARQVRYGIERIHVVQQIERLAPHLKRLSLPARKLPCNVHVSTEEPGTLEGSGVHVAVCPEGRLCESIGVEPAGNASVGAVRVAKHLLWALVAGARQGLVES